MVSPKWPRIVSSSPRSPSDVWSCDGPLGFDWGEVGAEVVPGAGVWVLGGGIVLGADGNCCPVGCALVVGRLVELPSGQTMTATTATTMTTAVASPAKIQTAGFCHHGDGACPC